jgi:dipeptidyl aminopeptidase/acylaminoacyl peptidase
MPEVPTKLISFDTSEGTFMNVDVAPDGETLIFDLLGDIYSLSINGGQATPLTTGRAWDSAPKYSQDGEFVYFISDRGGIKNIWRLRLSDQSLDRITASELNIEGSLNWSQDGSRLLAARSDLDNIERILQSIDPITGDVTPIDAPREPWIDRVARQVNRPTIKNFSAVQSTDGQVYFSESRFDWELSEPAVSLHTFDLESQSRSAITPPGMSYDEYMPQLSHGGCRLAYFRQYDDRRTEVRLLNLKTGQDGAIIELEGAEDASYEAMHDARPNYTFTPDDRHLILWHAGKLHRVTIADGSMEIIPFHVRVVREIWERAEPARQHLNDTGEVKIVRWPSVARDGRTMAFQAIGYVWVMDLQTAALRRLTHSTDFEYMPALSPDGKAIAYVSFAESKDDYWPGRLMVADVDGGTPRQVLAASNATFMLPSWSRDSQSIAVIQEVETDDGIEAAFGWTPATNGMFHKVAASPASSHYFNSGIYARTVGFDATGETLLFTFQRSKTEKAPFTTGAVTILAAAALDGSAQRTLAIGTPEVAGITPAPDLASLALTRIDETLWQIPFTPSAEPVAASALAPEARRISAGGGYYAGWNGSSEITFGFGQHVYRYYLSTEEREVLPIKVAFAKPLAMQPIAFKGARLLTISGESGVGRVIEPGTIVVDGRRISALGSPSEVTIPDEALIVDVTGKTIMPGLLDVHYHGIGGGVGRSALKLPNGSFNDRSALAYGVTTAWEPGNTAWSDGVPATAELQVSGRIVGPRWSYSAFKVGRPWEQVTTYANALTAVRQHQVLGAVLLKGTWAPNREHRQWISTAVHNQGLGMASHVGNFEGMLTGIVDGFTGGEHSYIPIPFFKDVTEMLRQSGYIWTPQIVITSGSVSGGTDVGGYYWQQAIKKYPLALKKLKLMGSAGQIEEVNHAAVGRLQVPYLSHRASRVAAQVASAAMSGVNIGVSAHNKPGGVYLLQGEMWYLWKGGMPIEDVLRATTIGNAQKLGLQKEIGSLEPGKIADFLVLDENPLNDILNALSLKYTVQGGVVYDSATAQEADLINVQE